MHSLRLFRDARYFQIIFQTLFLLYGIIYLHWSNEGLCFLYYSSSCILTQLFCDLLRNNFSIKPGLFFKQYGNGFKSALITAFGLCLLLKTNHWYICILAALLSITSKYILCYNKKHLFNPSAFGIAATILLTRDAWISPGQWGSNLIIMAGVCSLGFIVVTKVQKLDVTFAFLFTFIVLLLLRQIFYLSWPFDFFLQSITTGSLLLFSFFMISDPKTAPNNKSARIIWAVIIGAISFYLSAFKFINAAPVWVLVLSAPLVPLLDKIFIAKRFQWEPVLNLKPAKQKLSF